MFANVGVFAEEAQKKQESPAQQEAPAKPEAQGRIEDAHASHQVAKIVVCTSVANREAVGEVPETGVSATRVYCWMSIQSENLPANVRHVWYAGNEKVGEVTLKVASNPYRTWSSKNVWPGQWKVEAVSESGAVLDRKEFKINQ